jgi:hypothetical protein
MKRKQPQMTSESYNRHNAIAIMLALSLCLGGMASTVILHAAQTSPYITGFEAPDYTPGNLNGQNSWTVEGTASVQSAVYFEGGQSVEIGENSAIDIALSAAHSEVWIDGWVRTAGSDAPPPLDNMPPRSSLVFFGASAVQALDGDGVGAGSWVATGVPVAAAEWVRVSIQQDYTTKTWSLFLNSKNQADNLGFKDNDINQLNGFKQVSEGTSYLDGWSITEAGLAQDKDDDMLADLDELKIYESDPENPDSDGDGMKDGAEAIAGTDPNSSASVFALLVDPVDGAVITFPTTTGRTYTLQYKNELAAENWTNVDHPDFVGRTGDGEPASYVESDEIGTRFYRVLVRRNGQGNP